MDSKLCHPLPPSVRELPSPPRFTFPFSYEPHPLCVAAAAEVRRFALSQETWQEELHEGKMMGVLIVEKDGQRGFLAAFSGTLGGQTQHPYFVPPVFDLMAPGCHFQTEEAAISSINRQLRQLEDALRPTPLRQDMEQAVADWQTHMLESKARRDALRKTMTAEALAQHEEELRRESQFEKAELKRIRKQWQARIDEAEHALRKTEQQVVTLKEERHRRSVALQQWLFGQFRFLNARGEQRSATELFAPVTPPAAAGDCCAPKLLQTAYREGMKPICMAEFWIGTKRLGSVHTDGRFYPACNAKCRPILRHMLEGLTTDPNPMERDHEELLRQLRILYSDHRFAIVSKPSGMLSVPGKEDLPCVYDAMKRTFPEATGPIIVHRLDMDTSGLMVVALTDEWYHLLQDGFLRRTIHKTYHALLERPMPVGEEGDIRLPLRPDYDDRPRQLVDHEAGKQALTHYRVIGERDGHALVELQPRTGRTHQLRVHCAHPEGLGNPIVGDRLYGSPAERLMLHASRLEIDGQTFSDTTFLDACSPDKPAEMRTGRQ